MKPVAFDYVAPSTVDDAVSLLGPDVAVLAGGQSLVPLLNFRRARPKLVVDINALNELESVQLRDGRLRLGALTRHATLERSQLVAERWPLLRQAVGLVGHAAIRTRGTVGGSVAHADPAAELPTALTALDARFHVRSAHGTRVMRAHELFTGPFTTALTHDELLVEIEVPPLPAGARTAFVEHGRTRRGPAIAGVAVAIAPEHAAIALLGVGLTPVRATVAQRALRDGADAGEVGALAADLVADDYGRALVAELVRRAIEEARA